MNLERLITYWLVKVSPPMRKRKDGRVMTGKWWQAMEWLFGYHHHKWGEWGPEYKAVVQMVIGTKEGGTYEQGRQRRTCSECNAIDERVCST